MQEYLKKIQNFIVSPECIFAFQKIDYPNRWQQGFILNYFNIIKILQKPHTQIIRDLNSQGSQIPQGFLYLLLLNQGYYEQLQQYLLILRAETLSQIAQEFCYLLSEHGQLIKPCYLGNTCVVFNLLANFKMCSTSIIIQMSNFISYYQKHPESLTAIGRIIQNLNKKLSSENLFTNEQICTICHFILPKVIRVLPVFFEQACSDLIATIWSKYPQHCAQIYDEIVYIIESSNLYLKNKVVSGIYRNIQEENKAESSFKLIQDVCFSYLPKRVQKIFTFVFVNRISYNEFKYQLNWLEISWNNSKVNYLDILIDIARWSTLLDINELNERIEQVIIILEWVCKIIFFNFKDSFKRVKRALFNNWLISPYKFDKVIISLHVLKHFLQFDVRIFCQLISYVFMLCSSEISRQQIKGIFVQSIKNGYLKVQSITQNRMLPANIQQNFIEVMKQRKKQNNQGLQFNPQSPNKSEQGLAPAYNEQISQSQHEQQLYRTNSASLSPVCNYQQKNITNLNFFQHSQQISQLILQQEFVLEFDIQLQNLLDNPNYENFIPFFQKFLDVAGQARVENKKLLNLVLQQTCKILYCAYNNQFQDFENIANPQKSIIVHILNILLKEWHRITHRIQIIKSLIKKLCQMFPTAQVAIWFCFVMHMKPGANNRDFKNWIVPKQKVDNVILAVQTLIGHTHSEFRKGAQRYSLR